MKTLQRLKLYAALGVVLFVSAVDALVQRVVHASLLNGLQPALVPNHPGFAEFAQKVRASEGAMQLRWQPLYDTLLYPTAGAQNLLFFSAGQGAGVTAQPGGAGAVKALADTNLDEGGKLSGEAFFIHSIEVAFQPGSSAAAATFAIQIPSTLIAVAAAASQSGEHDVNAFYTGGALELFIGGANDVQFSDAPLLAFPPRAHFDLMGAIASNSATTALVSKAKMRAAGAVNMLNPGLGIAPGRLFGVRLLWPAAVATPSGFNGQVQVKMNGWRMSGLPA